MSIFTRRTVAVAIAITACAMVAPAASNATTRHLTARDDGRTIVVYPGDSVSLKLASCEASCGYRWETTKAPNSRILRTLSSSLNGQVRTFRYFARKSGNTSLRLSYDPPGTARATEHFTVRVQVKRSYRLGLRDGHRKGVSYLMRPRERLVIRLNSCEASCGYSWRTFDAPQRSILRRTSSKLIETSGRDIREFRYTARRRGRTTLGLGYKPPGSRRFEKTFRIRVIVR